MRATPHSHQGCSTLASTTSSRSTVLVADHGALQPSDATKGMSQPVSVTHVFSFQRTSTRASCGCHMVCISAADVTSRVVHATWPTWAGRPCRKGALSSPIRTDQPSPRCPVARFETDPWESRPRLGPSSLCQPPRDRGIQRRRARTPSIDELPRGDRTIRRLGHRLLRHTVSVTPSSRSSLGRGDSLTACTPPDRTPLIDFCNPHDPRTHPRALAPGCTAARRRRERRRR